MPTCGGRGDTGQTAGEVLYAATAIFGLLTDSGTSERKSSAADAQNVFRSVTASCFASSENEKQRFSGGTGSTHTSRLVAFDRARIALSVLEQIVLARNRDQHPENIWTLNVTHSERDLRNHPSPPGFTRIENKLDRLIRGLDTHICTHSI